MKQYTVAFTGGGTGGHVFPGIAVAEELVRENPDINIRTVWIGNRRGMEKDILSRFDIDFHSVPAGKLRRYFSLMNFIDIFRIAAGFAASFFLLRKLKVDLLFSKGGFVTVPPVAAAFLLKIPVISHESDLDPGLATRINGRFTDTMLFAYREPAEKWPLRGSRKVEITGNPVRSEVLQGNRENGRKLLEIPEDREVLLVLGGSQGALQINNLIEEIIEKLLERYFVIHQMGSLSYVKSDREGYFTAALFKAEFPDVLAASDLVISRAGAGTLWENGVTGKPAILIPLGTGSSRGDQIRNAEYFADYGAAEVLKGDFTSSDLLAEINRIMDSKKILSDMKKNVSILCNSDGSVRIADTIRKRLGVSG